MREKMQEFVNKKIKCDFEHDTPRDFVTSQWQPKDKSVLYLIYRWFVAGFYVFSFIFSFFTTITRGEERVYFIYLTNWNLFATMIMTVLAATLVTLYHTNRLQIPEKMTRPFKIYWFLFISTSMNAILVSFIYWAVLFHKDNNNIDLNNILVHCTNSLFLLIDIFVVKHRARISHFIWPLFCGMAYLIVLTYMYPALGGKNKHGQPYIYPIVNWNERPGMAVVGALGVLICGAIIHCLVVGLQTARIMAHKRICQNDAYKTVSKCSTKNDLAQMEAQFENIHDKDSQFILTS